MHTRSGAIPDLNPFLVSSTMVKPSAIPFECNIEHVTPRTRGFIYKVTICDPEPDLTRPATTPQPLSGPLPAPRREAGTSPESGGDRDVAGQPGADSGPSAPGLQGGEPEIVPHFASNARSPPPGDPMYQQGGRVDFGASQGPSRGCQAPSFTSQNTRCEFSSNGHHPNNQEYAV